MMVPEVAKQFYQSFRKALKRRAHSETQEQVWKKNLEAIRTRRYEDTRRMHKQLHRNDSSELATAVLLHKDV